VARLFAAFALLLFAAGSLACSGVSAEQRRRSAEIHYDLGTNCWRTATYRGPEGVLEAEKEDEDLPQTYNAMGLLYAYSLARRNRPRRASEGDHLDKDFSEARNNLGAFYVARGDSPTRSPVRAGRSAIRSNRDRMIAETNLGWALYKTGQAEQGMRRIEGALAIAPRYCLGWRQLGTIHAERGELPPPATRSRSTRRLPDTADAHLQAGRILARQTRAAEARVAFQRWRRARGRSRIERGQGCSA